MRHDKRTLGINCSLNNRARVTYFFYETCIRNIDYCIVNESNEPGFLFDFIVCFYYLFVCFMLLLL